MNNSNPSDHNTETPDSDNPLSGTTALIITVALIALVIGGWFSTRVFKPQPNGNPVVTLESGTFLNQASILSDFNLTDHDGNQVNLSSFKNKWTFLFFGYTHCPDICPNTLTTLKLLANQIDKSDNLKKQSNNTYYMFVSVDPQRDTTSHLKQFVQYFHNNFIGVTGTHPELQKLTRQLGILYSVEDSLQKKNYTVDHSAHIVLINPEGHYQALFSYPHDPRKLFTDYQQIRTLR